MYKESELCTYNTGYINLKLIHMKLPIKTIALILTVSIKSIAQPVLSPNHLPDYGVHGDIYLGANAVNPGTGDRKSVV